MSTSESPVIPAKFAARVSSAFGTGSKKVYEQIRVLTDGAAAGYTQAAMADATRNHGGIRVSQSTFSRANSVIKALKMVNLSASVASGSGGDLLSNLYAAVCIHGQKRVLSALAELTINPDDSAESKVKAMATFADVLATTPKASGKREESTGSTGSDGSDGDDATVSAEVLNSTSMGDADARITAISALIMRAASDVHNGAIRPSVESLRSLGEALAALSGEAVAAGIVPAPKSRPARVPAAA